MEIKTKLNDLEKRILKLITIPNSKTIVKELNIINYIKKHIPEIQEDWFGNLYIINDNTPLICAHMDNVWSELAQSLLSEIYVWPCVENIKKKNFKWILWQGNIWADDKCWLALAMELYKHFGNKISILFTKQEETWWHGSKYFLNNHKDLLDKCTYCVVPDRRNWTDFIWNQNDYCSKDFQTKILDIIWVYWFTSARWLWSDANQISEVINCFNISVWYYEPHTDNEYIDLDEFNNTYNALVDLIESFNEKLPPYEKPKFSRSQYSTNSTYKYSDKWWINESDDEDDEEWYQDEYGSWRIRKKESIQNEQQIPDDELTTDEIEEIFWKQKMYIDSTTWELVIVSSCTMMTPDWEEIFLDAWRYFIY